jgi:hypothetical protein
MRKKRSENLIEFGEGKLKQTKERDISDHELDGWRV